ncbi:hypothetical protein K438DRAFT_1768981 [Mycena galopus ATCC 62051]|nr:hypothetical protein K438DRAFT_1768981 [Mycena galopus ATCC 62051]
MDPDADFFTDADSSIAIDAFLVFVSRLTTKTYTREQLFKGEVWKPVLASVLPEYIAQLNIFSHFSITLDSSDQSGSRPRTRGGSTSRANRFFDVFYTVMHYLESIGKRTVGYATPNLQDFIDMDGGHKNDVAIVHLNSQKSLQYRARAFKTGHGFPAFLHNTDRLSRKSRGRDATQTNISEHNVGPSFDVGFTRATVFREHYYFLRNFAAEQAYRIIAFEEQLKTMSLEHKKLLEASEEHFNANKERAYIDDLTTHLQQLENDHVKLTQEFEDLQAENKNQEEKIRAMEVEIARKDEFILERETGLQIVTQQQEEGKAKIEELRKQYKTLANQLQGAEQRIAKNIDTEVSLKNTRELLANAQAQNTQLSQKFEANKTLMQQQREEERVKTSRLEAEKVQLESERTSLKSSETLLKQQLEDSGALTHKQEEAVVASAGELAEAQQALEMKTDLIRNLEERISNLHSERTSLTSSETLLKQQLEDSGALTRKQEDDAVASAGELAEAQQALEMKTDLIRNLEERISNLHSERTSLTSSETLLKQQLEDSGALTRKQEDDAVASAGELAEAQQALEMKTDLIRNLEERISNLHSERTSLTSSETLLKQQLEDSGTLTRKQEEDAVASAGELAEAQQALEMKTDLIRNLEERISNLHSERTSLTSSETLLKQQLEDSGALTRKQEEDAVASAGELAEAQQALEMKTDLIRNLEERISNLHSERTSLTSSETLLKQQLEDSGVFTRKQEEDVVAHGQELEKARESLTLKTDLIQDLKDRMCKLDTERGYLESERTSLESHKTLLQLKLESQTSLVHDLTTKVSRTGAVLQFPRLEAVCYLLDLERLSLISLIREQEDNSELQSEEDFKIIQSLIIALCQAKFYLNSTADLREQLEGTVEENFDYILRLEHTLQLDRNASRSLMTQITAESREIADRLLTQISDFANENHVLTLELNSIPENYIRPIFVFMSEIKQLKRRLTKVHKRVSIQEKLVEKLKLQNASYERQHTEAQAMIESLADELEGAKVAISNTLANPDALPPISIRLDPGPCDAYVYNGARDRFRKIRHLVSLPPALHYIWLVLYGHILTRSLPPACLVVCFDRKFVDAVLGLSYVAYSVCGKNRGARPRMHHSRHFRSILPRATITFSSNKTWGLNVEVKPSDIRPLEYVTLMYPRSSWAFNVGPGGNFGQMAWKTGDKCPNGGGGTPAGPWYGF